jgi:hypothetical protein
MLSLPHFISCQVQCRHPRPERQRSRWASNSCFEFIPVRFIPVLHSRTPRTAPTWIPAPRVPKKLSVFCATSCLTPASNHQNSRMAGKMRLAWIVDLFPSRTKPRAWSKLFRSLMQIFLSHPLSKRSAVVEHDLIPLLCALSVRPNPLSSNAPSAMKRPTVKPVSTSHIARRLKGLMPPDHWAPRPLPP